MGIVRRTPSSHRDYADIWDYIAPHNLAAADELLRVVHGARDLRQVFKRKR